MQQTGNADGLSNRLGQFFGRGICFLVALVLITLSESVSAASAPFIIDVLATSNSTDPSSPTYINDLPQGSSKAGVYSPSLPAIPEGDVFVITSFLPNDIKPNIRVFSRTGQLKLTYQTGYKGHQYSFMKAIGLTYRLITCIWWSNTSETLYLLAGLQISAAGDISVLGMPTAATLDRVVMVVDFPGTRYFFGVGISYVFIFDSIFINTQAFRLLSGSNNYPSFMVLCNNGNSLLVVYSPFKWATFTTTDLTPQFSNSVPVTYGSLVVDNLNQTRAFATYSSPINLCKRDLTSASYTTLDSAYLGGVGPSSILNVGSFDLVFLLPIIYEGTPISLQNNLLFVRKSDMAVMTYPVSSFILDPIQSTLTGFSNPGTIDSGMRFYFTFVRNLYNNFQGYYFLLDKCMSLDGLTLSCTTCPAGYWRADASTAAPRRCLSPTQFPPGMGMNNVTMVLEPCAGGASCRNCMFDSTKCISCNGGAGYYLDPVAGACLLKSGFPPRFGLNPWTKTVSACHDPNCLDCKDNIYICAACDVVNYWFLNETSKRCQSPNTFFPGFGVLKSNNTIATCIDPNCLTCQLDVSLCVSCDLNNNWYLNSTDGRCQAPATFAQAFGVDLYSKTIQVCADSHCLECKLDRSKCTACDTPSGYYLDVGSQKCIAPSNFPTRFGLDVQNQNIANCDDVNCIDCRLNKQVCKVCDFLSNWYLNSTNNSCQQPSTFSTGFGINSTARMIQPCVDQNCLNCTDNIAICYSCNYTNNFYWDPLSWRCIAPYNFPPHYGLDTSNFFMSKCTDPNCLECKTSISVCTKCDRESGWYLDPSTARCLIVAAFAPKYGIELTTGKIVPCASSKCLNCQNDYSKCVQCDTINGYYLNDTIGSCLSPTNFDSGFGVDTITNTIAKCSDPNCAQCQANIKVCVYCNVIGGWYLNTTSSKCQTPSQFAPGYGLDIAVAANPTIKPCGHLYCLDCRDNIQKCRSCDGTNNYFLNSTSQDCQAPQTFAAGYGVNKFSLMMDLCSDPKCTDCHTDVKVCRNCNTSAGWYLNSAIGACQTPLMFPVGFGVNQAASTMQSCTDPFCVDCRLDILNCTKCDTDKNYFLNETSNSCQNPTNFSQRHGADLVNRKIVACTDSNCLDCSQNYQSCRKCDMSHYYFLNSDGTCLKVSPTLPLSRMGANFLSGKIEPCRDSACDSCILDVNICSGCDFLNGFKMEGNKCIKSQAKNPKLKNTTTIVDQQTAIFEFYEPIQVSNLTKFFSSFTVLVTDLVTGEDYRCNEQIENYKEHLIRCTVQILPDSLEIAVRTDLDLVNAQMIIEDPNKIGVAPNGTIFGTQSNKLFTDYPVSARLVLADVTNLRLIGQISSVVYSYRMLITTILYCISQPLGVWLDRTLSDLNYLGYLEGKSITYPDLLFSNNIWNNRFLSAQNSPQWMDDFVSNSRCQTSSTFWRRGIRCSILSNLNVDIFAVVGVWTIALIGSLIHNFLKKFPQNRRIKPILFMPGTKRSPEDPISSNLLLSERAEAIPSLMETDGKHMPGSKDFQEEKLQSIPSQQVSDIAQQRAKLSRKPSQESGEQEKDLEENQMPRSNSASDDFKDLPIEEEAPIQNFSQPATNHPHPVKACPTGETLRAVASEDTPIESPGLPQTRPVRSVDGDALRPPRYLNMPIDSRMSNIGESSSLRESSESMPNSADLEIQGEIEQEQDKRSTSERAGATSDVYVKGRSAVLRELEENRARTVEGTDRVEQQQVSSAANKDSGSNLFLRVSGLFAWQFAVAKFEATQLDYILLSVVNFVHYSEGTLEITGLFFSFATLVLYAWLAKHFYALCTSLWQQNNLSQRPVIQSQAAFRQSGLAREGFSAFKPAVPCVNSLSQTQSLAYYFDRLRPTTQSFWEMTLPCWTLGRSLLLAHILVAMSQAPFLQNSFALILEILFTASLWKFGLSAGGLERFFTSLLSTARVLYLVVRLLALSGIFSEATCQYYLGYCMMSLVLGILLAALIYVVLEATRALVACHQRRKKENCNSAADDNCALTARPKERNLEMVTSKPNQQASPKIQDFEIKPVAKLLPQQKILRSVSDLEGEEIRGRVAVTRGLQEIQRDKGHDPLPLLKRTLKVPAHREVKVNPPSAKR